MQTIKRAGIWLLLGLILVSGLSAVGLTLSGHNVGQLLESVSSVSETDEDFGWGSPKRLFQFRLNDNNLLRRIPTEWENIGAGKTTLLYRDYSAVTGKTYVPRYQGKSPSCVGQATAAAVDMLAAVQIHSLGLPERYPDFRVDAASIYGMSRQEIGGAGPNAGGGSHNLWASQAIQKYGVLFMRDYPLVGIDLSEEDPDRCIEYGRDGVPDALEPIARLHPVQEYIAINSYEDLRDAIASGCPVIIGSKQGFGSRSYRRDGDGFLNAKWWSTWRHSMVAIGVADEGREGVLFINSWGPNWVGGPKRFEDEPEGCFWVDAYIVDRMVKQGDSYALRGYVGTVDYSALLK